MKDRIDYLDALRGVAAMGVLAQHTLEQFSPAFLEHINFGRLFVLLFFLLSGYVVPFSLTSGLKAFAVSRAARLFPALWLSILVTLPFVPVDGPTLAANMLMLAAPLGLPYVNAICWTLNFELLFYLACMVLYKAGLLHSARMIGVLVIATLWVGMYLPVVLFFSFMLAGLQMRIASEKQDEQTRSWAIMTCVAVVGVNALVGFRPEGAFLGPAARGTAMILALPIFLGVLAWRPGVPRSAIYLGTISYSVYLFHPSAMRLAEPLVSLPLLYGATVASMTFVVASLVYRTVEEPCIRLARQSRHGAAVAAQPKPQTGMSC